MKYYKALMPVLSVLVLVFIGFDLVKAYVSYPEKWATNSVIYDRSALSSGWKSAVWEGAIQWNNVTPSPFAYSATDSSSNTNDVSVAYIDGQYGTYAQTITYFPGGTTINRFTMKFDSGESWTGGLGPPSSSQLDSVSVAAHELGHALGLGETQWWRCTLITDENDRPTMCGTYYYGEVYFRYFEQDDIDAINYKYP